MKLYDLLEISDLGEAIVNKQVKENRHPIYKNLSIYEYTNETMYDRMWNDVTQKCRGLIVDTDSLDVLARPFDKFFNYNEPNAPVLPLDMPAIVTDKLDGSMGILYRRPDGFWEVSTKGSFQSEQGAHATMLMHQKYGWFLNDLDHEFTYMFEIIYPQNRIVLDYGDRDELVLIGARHMESGAVYYPNELPEWKWGRAEMFPYKTLREALEAPPRPNAEGYVIHFPATEEMVKVKQDDYLKLHKIVTGLTKKRIWENLSSGVTHRELAMIIPEEWHDWLEVQIKELQAEFRLIDYTAKADYRQLVKQLDKDSPGWDRKEFASCATHRDWTVYPDLLFLQLDGKNIAPSVWKRIMPKGD